MLSKLTAVLKSDLLTFSFCLIVYFPNFQSDSIILYVSFNSAAFPETGNNGIKPEIITL